MKDVTL